MRGTRYVSGDRHTHRGIIPAYAGNTPTHSYPTVIARDHPRVCGEHRTDTALCSPRQGSSPRMRGTLGVGVRRNVGNGIIPAYAGNTRWNCIDLVRLWDHPRVCGEHRTNGYCELRRQGSSPRMRGTLGRQEPSVGRPGIIPAYAGNTCPSATIRPFCRDHPRVCGEHTPEALPEGLKAGSSPRMRGTRQRLQIHVPAYWIIPAYAGNTYRT